MASRRTVIQALGLGMLASALPRLAKPAATQARARVIIDNDFAGDPDGLFELAHHLLSTSTEVRMVLGSHSHAGEQWIPPPSQVSSAAKAKDLMNLMGLRTLCPILAGAGAALKAGEPPAATVAGDAIIAEAMRTDTDTPLFYCAGAGLTDLASAWIREPRIGKRLTLIWIGGSEYPGIGIALPGGVTAEYNLTIDIEATQIIFGQSDIPIWQVPRSTYRQMLVSRMELVDQVRAAGPVGDWLVRQIENFAAAAEKIPAVGKLGETYILGDSPLVTLSSLQSPFQPDPSSSQYVLRACPRIDDQGFYIERSDGRPIRVYTQIDTRLTLGDFYAKLRAAHEVSA